MNRTPYQKVTKLKSKFSLTLGSLNRALNNPALACKYLEAGFVHTPGIDKHLNVLTG